jgi:hypothetical protein
MIVKKENNNNDSKKDLLLVDKTIKMKNIINEEGKNANNNNKINENNIEHVK